MNHEDMHILEGEKCCKGCTGDVKDRLKLRIYEMGFEDDQISLAINRLGLQICSGQEGCVCLQDSIYHLVDFINAHLGDNEEEKLLHSTSTQNIKVASESCVVGSKKQLLSDMGYEMNEICHAIDKCGENTGLEVLVDFIYATYGDKKESKVLESNVDMKGPQSSCDISEALRKIKGLDNINMNSHYETNAEDISIPCEYQLTRRSSELSEDVATESSDIGSKKQLLSDMGYEMSEICHAIDKCGDNSGFEVLVDFIYATYGCKKESKVLNSNMDMKRPQSSCELDNISMPSHDKTNDENINVLFDYQLSGTSSESSEDEMDTRWAGGASFSAVTKKKNMKRKHTIEEVEELDEENYESDNDFYTSPQCPIAMGSIKSMSGFSLPGSSIVQCRTVNPIMKGPPFFYFENIALMPKCEWDTITRFFNGIQPEFVDSIHFSACRRRRGYVHNLPIEGREIALPKPPMTIAEAFPGHMKFKPWWDNRLKLNCINTVRSSNTVCRKIADTLSKYDNDPPIHERKVLLSKLKKFNLLWVNPGRVAPLEPVEMEIMLGFEEEHTRGASSMTERYKALGNSFQVDTVAYHLSALRALYINGIKVLSLFSGIGGAEVALHKAGIPLKLVVSVEGNAKRRDVLESWWKRTGQRGTLMHMDNVQALNYDVLHELHKVIGGFDLVIGGSPCNNLTGSNRVTRVGLEGEHSRLFFEFPRIYNLVKQFQGCIAGTSK